MRKAIKTLSSKKLSDLVILGMQEKKGNDIVSLDLKKIEGASCDYFIICHGDSDVQVRAIADSIEDYVEKECGQTPRHKEGLALCDWVLIDYFDVVVHIFLKTKREYYGVEDLWGDAQTKHYKI
jgi:ribosome-associated protein